MKLKKLLILGLAFVVIATSTPIISSPINVEAATSYTVSKTRIGTSNCYWALTSDGTLEITGNGDPEINTYSSMYLPWYNYLKSIVKVSIANTVKPERMAFWFDGCSNLVEAPEIPNSVTDCRSMFQGCTSLVKAPAIPSSVIYCSQMFEGCDNLRSVYISCNPTSYTRMFEGVGSIDNPLTLYYRGSCNKSIAVELAATGKNVIVKDGNNYETPIQIGSSNCYWSVTSDGVLRITGEGDPGINAHFPNCPWLVVSERICKINISDSVKPISTAFWAYNCKNLVEAPEIPEGVTNCDNMFRGCTSLKGSITIPSSVTDCNSMFTNCTNIENVIISSNPIDYTSMFEGAGNINSKVAITMNEDCSEDVIKALANTGSNTYVVTSITSQPKNIQVGLGSDVIFNVRATGLDKKYQWYMADDKISEGKVLNGGVSSEYKLISSDITPELNNKYFYCVITDAYDNTTVSNRAKLTVVTAPTTPTFSAGVTSGSWSNKAINLELLGSNLLGDTSNIAYKYSLDGGVTWIDYINPFTWNTDTVSSTIIAKACHKDYPTSFSDEAKFIIKYDSTNPLITSCLVDDKTVTLTATDVTSGIDGYALTKEGNQIPEWQDSPVIEVENYGTYYAWAIDKAGNSVVYEEPIQVISNNLADEIVENNIDTIYDGNEHFASVTCENATITYGLSEDTYDLTEAPVFEEVGTYTVYYKVERDGYTAVTGMLTVVINEAQTPESGCVHTDVSLVNEKAATCKDEGYTGDIYCSVCDTTVAKGTVIAKSLNHTWGTDNKCSVCDISKPSSSTDVGQTNPQHPSTQQPSTQQLNADSTKEITTAKNVKAKVSKLTNKKGKKLQIKIKKQKGYKYEVQVSTSKKFKKSVKKYNTSKTTYTVKKLNKGKKYYVRVRTYKTIEGKKVYGKWSPTKSIKIKK